MRMIQRSNGTIELPLYLTITSRLGFSDYTTYDLTISWEKGVDALNPSQYFFTVAHADHIILQRTIDCLKTEMNEKLKGRLTSKKKNTSGPLLGLAGPLGPTNKKTQKVVRRTTYSTIVRRQTTSSLPAQYFIIMKNDFTVQCEGVVNSGLVHDMMARRRHGGVSGPRRHQELLAPEVHRVALSSPCSPPTTPSQVATSSSVAAVPVPLRTLVT